MMLYKMIASCGGIGKIKGGGTIAAALYTILWFVVRPSIGNTLVQVIVFLVVTGVGVFISNRLEAIWGKDSNKIVIDEVAGMCCTLLLVPHQWPYALMGLAAFRFFDIVKPFYLRRLERFPGGWGVMLDDLGAGLYAHLILSVTIASQLY